jgi:RNAse (barnase) inhibitor barstar
VDIIKRYFLEYYAPYSTDIDAWNQIMESDFSNPLELDLHHFERPNDFMFHGHKKTVCPAIKDLKKKIEASDYYK